MHLISKNVDYPVGDRERIYRGDYIIANLVSDEELNSEYILPMAFDERIGEKVARAVAQAARESGVARI